MKEEKFMTQVDNCFDIIIEKLDETADDYAMEFYSFDSVLPYNKKVFASDSNKYYKFLKKCSENEEDVKKDHIIINEDFSAKINGQKTKCFLIKYGIYCRKESGKEDRFEYYELYEKDGILSILCKPKFLPEILEQKAVLSKKDRDILKKFSDFSQSLFDPIVKENNYTHDWIKKYEPSDTISITVDDIKAIESCKDQKLFFSILGYSILAFSVEYGDREYSICPINIITDNESSEVIEALISNCFIYTGEKNGIMKFPLNKTSRNDFKESFGRTIIIDTTKCENVDIIKSKTMDLMPKLYQYLEVDEREIKYPYSCLPIFVSKVKLGPQFININAAGLKSSEWQDVIKLIHKLYEYPFYSIYNKLNDYDPVESLFVESFSEITDKIESNFKDGKKHFNNTPKPQDITLPQNYYNMMNLLRACCLTVSDFFDYWDDGPFWYHLEELINRTFLSETLSDCNSNNKTQSGFDDSNSSEQIRETKSNESNFFKILKSIGNCTSERPATKEAANLTAFLYKVNDFNAICLRKDFFEKLVKNLSINDYNWNDFRDDCRNNNLTEHDNTGKDINVKIGGKSIKFYGINKDRVSNYLLKSQIRHDD